MPDRLEVMFSPEQIQDAVRSLAAQVDETLGGEPVLLVGVLKGSIHFLSDLARALQSESQLDFIQVSSYGGSKSSSGVVQIRKDIDQSIEGKNVILVEDIVDTGITLNHLRELLSTRKPKTLRVVCLLSKPEARQLHPEVEFIGFEIPKEFVVGYGLDYDERFRNLPYVAVLREE